METNKAKLDEIIDAIEWSNFEHADDRGLDGAPTHWDVCEVLHSKLEHLDEWLHDDTLPADDLDEHIETIKLVQDLLSLLNEEKLRTIIN